MGAAALSSRSPPPCASGVSSFPPHPCPLPQGERDSSSRPCPHSGNPGICRRRAFRLPSAAGDTLYTSAFRSSPSPSLLPPFLKGERGGLLLRRLRLPYSSSGHWLPSAGNLCICPFLPVEINPFHRRRI